MKLEWSLFAVADREQIFDYIEVDNPRAAIAMDDRIQDGVDGLQRFPESGRPGRVDGTRELVLADTPYIVAYQVEAQTIRILRVLHGAQLWPDGFEDTKPVKP